MSDTNAEIESIAAGLWPARETHTSWDELVEAHEKGFADNSKTLEKYRELARGIYFGRENR